MPIKPSVGRVVLVRSSVNFYTGTGQYEEVPALVTGVIDENTVDLMIMRRGHHATPIGKTGVPYVQEPEQMLQVETSWRWMNYQLQEAAARDKPAEPTTTE